MDRKDDHIFIKILLLAFLLLLLYSWFTFHIYNDLISKITGAFLTFWAFVSFFISYQKKESRDKFKDILSKWLSGILNYRFIAFLYILFFISGSFISSVHIYSNNNKNITVSIYDDRDSVSGKLGPQKQELKHTILTTPFGRTMMLAADGYQKAQVQIFPWTGKRIIVEQYLKISPTLILRIPEEHFMQLSKARINIDTKGSKKTFETDRHTVIVIGQSPEIPEKYCNKWLNELRATYENNIIIYKVLNKWCDTTPLFIPLNLGTYDSIRVDLISRAGDTLAVCKGITDTGKFKELRFKNREK